ncbi:MAG TPA: MBL fold metallo-hydrolase [Xanthobacteraceae bacterium]|jgi:glyoxylase-like metal-dependent hydrolase (beta-lactamase superfamily II)
MYSKRILWLATAMAAAVSAGPLAAQAPQTPAPAAPAAAFTTVKVEGTDNVYLFRYSGYQSMFVVTPEGVIATDPASENRPAAEAYIGEIRKITQAPIRYVIYSHHHSDHTAGGKPFKDLGATFIAHTKAKERLAAMGRADIVLPDETVDDKRTLTLGGTELELSFVGRNHSDNSLVMRLPKEKLLFAVDFAPVRSVLWRNMPDSYLPDWNESLKRVLALDWDRLIPGHPYDGGLGTKQDIQNLLAYMDDLSGAVKTAADAGKCPDAAKAEVKLPKYASWVDYAQDIAGNVERYCTFWTTKQ